MGRPYSQDLRERVVDAAGATSRRQAARFGVGVATAIRWMAALTTTGTVAARPQVRARRSKLDPSPKGRYRLSILNQAVIER